MMRWAIFAIIFLWTLAVPVLGEGLPQVLQPSAYSASEAAALTQRIANLEKALADYTLGCRRMFGPDGWSSCDFAAYTAGILMGKGYKTILVSGPGWPDGVHTWVLVGLALDGKTAWVPVEVCPQMGRTQPILGKVPMTAASREFDPRYLNFTGLVDLPPNMPPVAKIRPPSERISVGDIVHIFAVGSYDPDGTIVLYRWNFGDGESKTYTIWLARHTFDAPKVYKITLTVVDNRGKTATTTIALSVIIPENEEVPRVRGGCGCGH